MDKAGYREVRTVDLQYRRGVWTDRRLIVSGVSAVSGSDVNEIRARLRHDIGYSETATDLDGFAARYDDLTTIPCERAQRQQRARRIVVNRDARLGAGDGAQQRRHM